MQGDKLIRRSYSGRHLTCIKYPQTLEVLCKIQDEECGNHSGSWSLAQKALTVDVIAANGTNQFLICLPKSTIRRTVNGLSCNGPLT
ncbi:unnamed protein product [Prunus armeniaca]